MSAKRHHRSKWLLSPGALLGGSMLLLGLVTAWPSAAGAQGEQTYSGDLFDTGCNYSLTATPTGTGDEEWASGTLSGTIACGSLASVQMGASWADTSGTVSITSLTGSLDGQTLNLSNSLPMSIGVPDDPTTQLDQFVSDVGSQALTEAQDLGLSSPLTFGPVQVFGGACSFEATATWDGSDWTSGTLTGTATCGAASLAVSATWDGTSLSFGDITGTFDGQSVDDSLEDSFELLFSGGADLGDFLTSVGTEVESEVTSFLGDQLTGIVDNASSQAAVTPGNVLSDFDGYCDPLLNPAGPSDSPPSTPPPSLVTANADCHTSVGYNNNDNTVGPDAEGYGDMDSAGSPTSSQSDDADEAQACPMLANDPPPSLFVICVPTLLAGDFNAGSDDVVLVPGGALIALPVGSSTLAPTTPSIETSSNILLVGGAIGGANLKMSASAVEIAGADISMTGALSITAKTMKVGEVDVQQLLGYVPGTLTDTVNLPGDVGTGANDVAGWLNPQMSATMTASSQIWAGTVTLRTGPLTIASGSVVTADGLGGLPQPVPPTTPTIGPGDGAGSGDYGGSHIGYGGIADDTTLPDTILDPGQRQPTYDSPFDPTKPGNGGDGVDEEDEMGGTGGGVVAIEASQLVMDGTVRANGDDVDDPDPGGAGAGGTVNIQTGALSGSGGTLEANGGDLSVASDDDYYAGQGGGGAVAVTYTSDTGFGATMSAHGGNTNFLLDAPHSDIGGAGTVFLDKVATAPPPPTAPTAGGLQPRTPGSTPRLAASLASSQAAVTGTLSGLTLSVPLVVPAATGGSIAASAPTSTTGTSVSYSDSAAAVATFTVESVVGTKVTKVGSFTHTDTKGTDKWQFTGRLGSSALKPGAYELVGTAGAKPQVEKAFDVVAGSQTTPPSPSGTSGGVLTIDGGYPAPYPRVEPTPMPASWSNPNRDLIISGGAVVYATSALFAKVTLSSYATLAPPEANSSLTVTAGEIDIQPTARIDATARGYAGGVFNGTAPYSGQTAPGAKPSQGSSGGSHAGTGGVGDSTFPAVGTAYDNPYDPVLAGGGGGGDDCDANGGYDFRQPTQVGGGTLYVTTGDLIDDGVISANGQDSNGPMITLRINYQGCGGAGAGGSVQVHAAVLSGTGSITADGGNVCDGDAQLVNTNPNYGIEPCTDDTDGAGGGGLVLVVAPVHSGFTGKLLASGGVNYITKTVIVGGQPKSVAGTAGHVLSF